LSPIIGFLFTLSLIVACGRYREREGEREGKRERKREEEEERGGRGPGTFVRHYSVYRFVHSLY